MTYDLDYFEQRRLSEPKHVVMCTDWIEKYQPENCLDVGCGMGLFTKAMNDLGVECVGIDFSLNDPNIASMVVSPKASFGMSQTLPFADKEFDMVLLLDILEHLPSVEDVRTSLKEASRVCKNVTIFSIPFLGNPDLMGDPTHTIFKTREWWVYEISKYFNLESPPQTWAFSPQILTGVPKK